MHRKLKTGLLGLGLIFAAPFVASAATLGLSYEQTAAGITGAGTGTTIGGVATSLSYGQSFGAAQSAIPGAPAAPGTPNYYGFYDDFLFTVGAGTVDGITSTIDLGSMLNVSNLQARLYSYSGNPSLPVLSAPNGGAIDSWSSSYSYAPGLTGTVAVLPWTQLGAGTYVLEVRGTAIGSGGGSYSGVLNVTPVPLPAALPLLLTGLGFVGRFARRPLSA